MISSSDDVASTTDVSTASSPQTKKKKARAVRFAESPAESPRPRLALAVVEYLLQHPVNRAILLRKNRPHLADLRDCLQGHLPDIGCSLRKEKLEERERKKLASAWTVLLKLTVLLRREETGGEEGACSETLERVEELLEWLGEAVLEKEERPSSKLGRSLALSACSLCTNMVTIEVCDVNFVGHLLDLCGNMVDMGE